jgi:hypothetical protein
MSTSEAARAWDGLMELLSYDRDLTDEEVLAGLRQDGVDAESFLARIGETVRKGIQANIRQKAEKERAVQGDHIEDVHQQLIRFPIEKVRQIIDEASAGKYGAVGRELAIACRNQREVNPTEEELRNLAEDILIISVKDVGSHGTNIQG